MYNKEDGSLNLNPNSLVVLKKMPMWNRHLPRRRHMTASSL